MSSQNNSTSETSADTDSTVRELRIQIEDLTSTLNETKRSQVEYLQNVAHQLVAPLNAMKWHIENLMNARVSVERGQKVLRSVYSQATIAVHLAKNFALMTNLDADHSLAAMREALQPVNLDQLLVNLADDFQPQGWERNIHVEVESFTFENAPDVLVIKPLISQVFSNIIENAIKYSHERTKVLVSAEYHSSADLVVVEISNNGIPLSQTDAERIFERGFRSVSARNKYPAGTGFGLFIAKRIVEIHEGDLDVETDGSGNTCFEVTLPVKALEGKAKQWPKKG